MAKKILIISVLLLAAAFPVKGNENSEKEQLYRSLLDNRQAVRDDAAKKLIRLLPPVNVQSLVTDLQDKDPAKRFLACYRLSELRSRYRYIPIMFNVMKDSHPYVREVAYSAIADHINDNPHIEYEPDYLVENISKTRELVKTITSPEIIGPLIASIDCKTVGNYRCDCSGVYDMLELIRPPSALPVLRQRLEELKDFSVIPLLGHIPDKRSTPALLKVLRVTREEFTVLARKWEPEKAKDPERLKSYVDWYYRKTKLNTLWALGEISGPRAITALEQYFKSTNDSFKTESALALLKNGRYGLYKALADWTNGQTDIYDRFWNPWREAVGNKKNALKILPYLSHPRAIIELFRFCPDEVIGIPGILDKLNPLLENYIEPTVVEQLFKLLSRMMHRTENNKSSREKLIHWLYRLVKKNDVYRDGLLESSTAVFSTFTDETVVRLFIPDLESANPYFRDLAVRVLGNPVYKQTIPHLLPMLEDPEIKVRRSACVALAKIDDDSAIPYLVHRLFDPNVLVREDAADALRAFNKPEAIVGTTAVVSAYYKIFSSTPGMLPFLQKRLMPGDENRPDPKQQAKKDESLISDMVISQEKGLTLLKFDPEKRKYRPTHSYEIPWPRDISVSGGFVLASSYGKLYRFGSHLQMEKQTLIGKEIETFTVSPKGTVFAAAQNSIVSVDRNFQLLDVLELPVTHAGPKDAHDLLIKGERLYVLDNFLLPYFILRLDYKNPYQLKLEKKHIVLGVNHWLSAQALDARKREWLVLSQFDSGSQSLFVFDSDTVMLKSEFPWNLDYKIKAMLSGSPPKVLIIKDSVYHLASIDTEPTKAVFFDFTPLNITEAGTFSGYSFDKINTAIKQRGPYIYVTIRDNLLVLDSNGIVLSHKLESPVIDFDLL